MYMFCLSVNSFCISEWLVCRLIMYGWLISVQMISSGVCWVGVCLLIKWYSIILLLCQIFFCVVMLQFMFFICGSSFSFFISLCCIVRVFCIRLLVLKFSGFFIGYVFVWRCEMWIFLLVFFLQVFFLLVWFFLWFCVWQVLFLLVLVVLLDLFWWFQLVLLFVFVVGVGCVLVW